MKKHRSKITQIGIFLIMVSMIFMIINLVVMEENNVWILAAQLCFCVVGITFIASEERKRRIEDKAD
jgi:L-asparagine transporter-like permease